MTYVIPAPTNKPPAPTAHDHGTPAGDAIGVALNATLGGSPNFVCQKGHLLARERTLDRACLDARSSAFHGTDKRLQAVEHRLERVVLGQRRASALSASPASAREGVRFPPKSTMLPVMATRS